MNEQAWREIMSGRRRGAGASLLRAAMRVASWGYRPVVRLRRWAYRHHILPSHAADVPVICVGNITTGGTGKTPMTAWVVQQLREAGLKPAILTRGYKSGDGKSDEAELLRDVTAAPVIVEPDRVAGAARAAGAGADVVVMDDGYQHRRLRRDLDIVLISATNPFGYEYCLPRGLLREPPRALRDADAVVVTHAEGAAEQDISALTRRLTRLAPKASVHVAAHRPLFAIDEQGNRRPLSDLQGRMVCAFCGLADPDSFFVMLSNLGVRLVSRHPLDDHFRYDADSVERLCLSCQERSGCRANLHVTTQKDYVKLKGIPANRPVWQLVIGMEVLTGRDELVEKVVSAARRG
ncbi:MAG: tetraacyldisaccharide 4'-kinase [Phycisphaerae bacterium]